MLHAFHSIDDSNFRSFACAVRVVCRNRTCCTPPKKTCEQMWTKNPEHRKWNLCVISHTFKRIKLKFKFKLPQQINQMSIWNYISQECVHSLPLSLSLYAFELYLLPSFLYLRRNTQIHCCSCYWQCCCCCCCSASCSIALCSSLINIYINCERCALWWKSTYHSPGNTETKRGRGISQSINYLSLSNTMS